MHILLARETLVTFCVECSFIFLIPSYTVLFCSSNKCSSTFTVPSGFDVVLQVDTYSYYLCLTSERQENSYSEVIGLQKCDFGCELLFHWCFELCLHLCPR